VGNASTGVVILGSDPDSACYRMPHNSLDAESGSDTNITAQMPWRYHFDSFQRFLDVRYSPIWHMKFGELAGGVMRQIM